MYRIGADVRGSLRVHQVGVGRPTWVGGGVGGPMGGGHRDVRRRVATWTDGIGLARVTMSSRLEPERRTCGPLRSGLPRQRRGARAWRLAVAYPRGQRFRQRRSRWLID